MDESITLRFRRGSKLGGHREAKNLQKDKSEQIKFSLLYAVRKGVDNRRIPFSFQICKETLKTKLPNVFLEKIIKFSSSSAKCSLESQTWPRTLILDIYPVCFYVLKGMIVLSFIKKELCQQYFNWKKRFYVK